MCLRKRANSRPAMKIIFSDIDGILNRSRTPNPRKFPYVAEPQLVARFMPCWSGQKHK